MGIYDPVPLGQWSPMDVARNIVNQVLDQFPEITVERRQAMNDVCDDFVSGLLDRWLQARSETMRDALIKLEQWDMLHLGPDGRGSAAADAPWARALIAKALRP